MPSQQSSLSGRRTVLIRQDAIALTLPASLGPSKMLHPCTQAYSVPARFTPSRRTCERLLSTNRFPEIRRAGAGAAAVAALTLCVGPRGVTLPHAASVAAPSNAADTRRSRRGNGVTLTPLAYERRSRALVTAL